MNNYKHWQLQVDEKIAWLGLNRLDTSVNSLNDDVLDELDNCLQALSELNELCGLIIYSSKSKGFIAGADVNAFAEFDNSAKASDFLRKGQTIFSRLEMLSRNIPSVAMIHGFCLGGGLELALACTYRIASDDHDTRLGLPEIMLGIHPGWGGTVRLPQLIGGFAALSQIILTGRAVPALQAKQLGFVDEVTPLRQLKKAAIYYVTHQPHKRQPSFIQSLTNHVWFRPMIAKIFRYQTAKKVNATNYPAPFAVIDLWEKEYGYNERAYQKEADSVQTLISGHETAKNLIRLFQLKERMKGFSKKSRFKAQHVHVIGAGIMGGDIAAWCALKGIKVTLQDQSYGKIALAVARANDLFKKKLKKARPIQASNDRLIPDPKGHGIANADVIIEAVFENLQVKQTIIKQVEQVAKATAIIATNTSSIPLNEISEVMNNPERLVGIHFFNPVSQMELVEVVTSDKTATEVSECACAFVGQIGRMPLPVKSSPGFLINRVLMPYLMECIQLLDEGVKAETIDAAATSFGMMMGPVEMADTVGIDVCLAVAENLTAHFGGTISNKLRNMVNAGQLGRKSGEGFYRYKNGKPIKQKILATQSSDDTAKRMILRMIIEANNCLHEQVVVDNDLLDAGMVFASGFAPFRGGPMHYASQLGPEGIKDLSARLVSQYGERFSNKTIA
ncbi:MAG: 3-hydroxyacyl-CoA dehydrogenase NAD-binding domain-containing protein [Legionella sp.]